MIKDKTEEIVAPQAAMMVSSRYPSGDNHEGWDAQDASGEGQREDFQENEVEQEEWEEEEEEEEETEEEEVIMDEEEMLRMLDKIEPPLSVCQRLLKVPPDLEAPPSCEGKVPPGAECDDSYKVEMCRPSGDGGTGVHWRVLTEPQRASLGRQGFTVVDCLVPPDVAAEAYREAVVLASSGSLSPAHGGAEDAGDEDVVGGQLPRGYLRSVRDDLTTFLSRGKQAVQAEGAEGGGAVGQGRALDETGPTPEGGEGAISRVLGFLGVLEEDLRRMVRLRGTTEHQLAVYPGGVGARYERHRDAYPDDGLSSDDEQETSKGRSRVEEAGKGKNSTAAAGDLLGDDAKDRGAGGDRAYKKGESVSCRRVTAVCYIRDRGPWSASEGGALRLYPPEGTGGATERGGKVRFCRDLGGEADGGNDIRHEEDWSFGTGDADTLKTSRCSVGIAVETIGTENGCCDSVAVAAPSSPLGSSSTPGIRGVGGVGSAGEAFIDVAPLAGRAVVFLSGAVEHEVLPVTGEQPRAAITAWFH